MAFLKLALIFAAIIILLACKRPLWQSILGGLAATAILYQIFPSDMVHLTEKVIVSRSSPLFSIRFFHRIWYT